MEQTLENARTILVVDDSALSRKRVHQMLQNDGFALVDADSGLAALKALSERTFDFILTDLVMPGLDGFGLLAEIQKLQLQTPVVVVSADVQHTTRDRCKQMGARDILQKPVNSDALHTALASFLGPRP